MRRCTSALGETLQALNEQDTAIAAVQAKLAQLQAGPKTETKTFEARSDPHAQLLTQS
jgi:hypothetical protein